MNTPFNNNNTQRSCPPRAGSIEFDLSVYMRTLHTGNRRKPQNERFGLWRASGCIRAHREVRWKMKRIANGLFRILLQQYTKSQSEQMALS